NARTARWPSSVGSSPAPSPSTTTSLSPSSTWSSFQRSSAAAAQSNPGPRLAVEAGAPTITTRPLATCPRASRGLRKSNRPSTGSRAHLGENCLDGGLDERRAGGQDVHRGRVLEAVAREHADGRGARHQVDLQQRGQARGGRGLAEDALAARDLE